MKNHNKIILRQYKSRKIQRNLKNPKNKVKNKNLKKNLNQKILKNKLKNLNNLLNINQKNYQILL